MKQAVNTYTSFAWRQTCWARASAEKEGQRSVVKVLQRTLFTCSHKSDKLTHSFLASEDFYYALCQQLQMDACTCAQIVEKEQHYDANSMINVIKRNR